MEQEKPKQLEHSTRPSQGRPTANSNPHPSPNQLRGQGRATDETKSPGGLTPVLSNPALSPTTTDATHTDGSHKPGEEINTPLKKNESPGKGPTVLHPFKPSPTHQIPRDSNSREGNSTQLNTSDQEQSTEGSPEDHG